MFCPVFKQLCDSESFDLPMHHFIHLETECFPCSSPKLNSSMESIKVIQNIFFIASQMKIARTLEAC